MKKVLKRPEPRFKCLGARVLVAAKFTYLDAWKAFILPVAGRDFTKEVEDVYANGDRLDEDLACYLFPEFEPFTYDR